MKILVLGGFGFLGQSINKVFQNSEYEIVNESRRTGCDILNAQSLREKIRRIGPDLIINAAAHVGSISYVTKYSADVCNDNSLMYVNLYKVIKNRTHLHYN